MVAVKFEPSENWLPPAYTVKSVSALGKLSGTQKSRIRDSTKGGNDEKRKNSTGCAPGSKSNVNNVYRAISAKQRQFDKELEEVSLAEEEETAEVRDMSPESTASSNALQNLAMPYCLQMQHSLPDKSIADCVEALIGCYLASCGRRSALLFMDWLGLRVLPPTNSVEQQTTSDGVITTEFGCLPLPASPLLVSNVDNPVGVLEFQLDGYEAFEEQISYRFRDRSYLLQAFTHASYHYNSITDCYQRYVVVLLLLLHCYLFCANFVRSVYAERCRHNARYNRTWLLNACVMVTVKLLCDKLAVPSFIVSD
jgi:endoribonuclease Dicer